MAVVALLLTACEGRITTPAVPGSSPSIAPAGPAAKEGMSLGAFSVGFGLRRLTRFEYGNTVADLVGVEGAEQALPADSRIASFTNNVHGLKPSAGLVQALALSAEAAAAAAVPRLALPAGCSAATLTDACFDAFLAPFLRRAFRRPPTPAELQRLTALFGSLAQTAPRSEALRGVVEAVLMSPSFLYRPEASAELTGYEVASRLSYLLWASLPDEALLAAAEQGELSSPAGRLAQLERMWSDGRTRRGLVHFASEWLGVEHAAISRKNAEVLAGAPASLAHDLELELALLVENRLVDRGGSLEQFLAGKTTYVTAALAQHYGLPVAGAGVQAVSLEGTERRGALTSGLVIAAHAKESGFSVPQLGKFIRQAVLCQAIPGAPPNAVNERAMPTAGQTYREAFAGLTERRAECNACHQFINPPGFAYLAFDPVGRHLTADPSGRPIDSAAAFPRLDGETVGISGAAELAEKTGASARARECFARMAIEYALGRTLASEDLELHETLASALRPNETNAHAVLARLVASDAFTRRGPTP